MLSFKQWKTLNESYDIGLGLATPSTLGVDSPLQTLEDLISERKKMKKKMMGEMPNMDDEDESGDGEMVEPSSLKDKAKCKPMDDEDEDDDDQDTEDDEIADDDDEEDMENPLKAKVMMMKKKMKGGMKKKMAAEQVEEEKEEVVYKRYSNHDDDLFKSLSNMMGKSGPVKNWDGISVKEDALLPLIDPNTGNVISEPEAGEVGFAPQTRIGEI